MLRWIDLFVIALVCLVVAEVLYPTPQPPKPAPKGPPRFDQSHAPKEIFDKCRSEGKQAIAMQADGKFWGFECIHLEKR